MRDRLLRALAIFTGYEALNWYGLKLLIPPAQWMLAFLMLTAVGLATLLVYLLWVVPQRIKVAPNPATATPEATAPISSQQEPSTTAGPRVTYPSRPDLPLYLLIGSREADKRAILGDFLKDAPPSESQGKGSFQIYRPRKENSATGDGDYVIADVEGELFEGDNRKWDSMLRRLRGTGLKKWIRPLRSGDSAANSELRGMLLVLSFEDLAAHGFFPPEIADKLHTQATRPSTLVDPTSYASQIAERLETVGQVFSAQFPVHVILTHLDRVPYAPLFLAKLSGSELKAPFGAVLDISANDRTTELGAGLRSVFQAIAQYRVPVLQKTKVSDETASVYQFPRELMKLRPGVASFLTTVFQRFGTSGAGPILRSIHFTGVKQPSASSYDPQKTFFVADFWSGGQTTASNQVVFAERLWTDRILRDQFLARLYSTNSRMSAWKMTFVFSGLIAIVCLWGIASSWVRNREFLNTIASVTESNQSAFAGGNAGVAGQLNELDRLRSALATLSAYDQRHPGMGWGLYQGGLSPEVHDLYFREFRKVLLDPVLNVIRYRFEHLGSAGFVTSFETVKNDVRVYQMVHGQACEVDPDFLAAHLLDIWKNHAPETSALSTQASAQFRFYATELKRQDPYKVQPNPALLGLAQSYLQSFRGMDDVFAAIIAEANGSLKSAQVTDVLDDVNEKAELSRNYSQALEGPDKMQAAFARGNQPWVRQRMVNWKQSGVGDACIFGKLEPAGTASVAGAGEQELQRKYETSFIVEWKKFLATSHVRLFSAREGVGRLELLAQNRSPLLALFAFVGTNTATSAEASPVTPAAPPTKVGSFDVFRPVWLVVPPGKPNWKGVSTDAYIQSLRTVRESLQNFVDKPSADETSADEVRAASRIGLNTVESLSNAFGNGTEGIDHEVERLLREPFLNAVKTLPPPKRKGEDVDQALKEFCAQWQPLLKKFPFNSRSTDEVSPEEFKSIFQPKSGKLWDLVAKGIVVKSAESTWVSGPAAKDVRLDEKFLDFFRRMMTISDQFFHNGTLGFSYSIRVQLNPHLRQVSFNVDGQNGGVSPTEKRFLWPAANASGFYIYAGNAPFAYPGVWSVFRMVLSADMRTGNGVELSKTKPAGGMEAPLLGDDGKPTKLELVLPDLPGSISESIFSNLDCPRSAIQRLRAGN